MANHYCCHRCHGPLAMNLAGVWYCPACHKRDHDEITRAPLTPSAQKVYAELLETAEDR